MKDFIIYLQPKKPKTHDRKKYSLEELRKLPFSSALEELNYVKDGEISLIRETNSLNIFNFSGEFQLPRPHASMDIRYSRMDFRLYQQKRGNVVISLEAPKKLSKVAIALLSYITFGDLYSIKPITLSRDNFLNLENYVLKIKGDLRQLILSSPKSREGEAIVKQFRMSGKNLEKLPDFNGLLNRFSKIRLFGFSFKPADCRNILFRIIEWGGGQLYSPADPLDHEIDEFLDIFNNILNPEE